MGSFMARSSIWPIVLQLECGEGEKGRERSAFHDPGPGMYRPAHGLLDRTATVL